MESGAPEARRTGLVVETVEDDLVVYDRERDRAHRLNCTAALIWRHADGHRSVADLADVLRRELDPHADEDLVWVTLDRLGAAHLLQAEVPRSAEAIRTSRRQFVRKVGLVGSLALLLPMVTTITAPTPAEAQSCNCLVCCDCTTCGTCDTGFPNCFTCITCDTNICEPCIVDCINCSTT